MKKVLGFILVLSIVSTCTLHAQWSQTNIGLTSTYVAAFAVSGTNLFAGTNGGVFLSTNNGTSWEEVNTGLMPFHIPPNIRALVVSGAKLFAGTFANGVFLSTNNGTSWTAVNNGLSTLGSYEALIVSGTNIFAGSTSAYSDKGVFLSTNNGTSWTQVNTGLTYPDIFAFAISGTNLFAGGVGVFLSTNNGTSWTAAFTGMTNANVRALAISGTYLFAGTNGNPGIYLSINNGSSWTAVNTGLTYPSVDAFAISGTNLFAGTDGGGVFLSTNNGTSWTAVNTGLTNTHVGALAVSSTYLFAGTEGGVWRRPLSEMITGVEDQQSNLPTSFTLQQNFPNPFNPTTTIRYDIPKESFVTLKIFNAVGEEVKSLVNENKSAGSYEVKFDGSNLSSGVYFYRITADNPSLRSGQGFTQTKKLILLK